MFVTHWLNLVGNRKTKTEKKQKKEPDKDGNDSASLKEMLEELTQTAKSQEESIAAISRQLKEQKDYVDSKLLIFSKQLPHTPGMHKTHYYNMCMNCFLFFG